MNQAGKDAQVMVVFPSCAASGWGKACFLSEGIEAHRRGKLVYVPASHRESALSMVARMEAAHPNDSPKKVYDAGDNGSVIYRHS